MASRTRSDVGRTWSPTGALRRRPRYSPPITRIGPPYRRAPGRRRHPGRQNVPLRVEVLPPEVVVTVHVSPEVGWVAPVPLYWA